MKDGAASCLDYIETVKRIFKKDTNISNLWHKLDLNDIFVLIFFKRGHDLGYNSDLPKKK